MKDHADKYYLREEYEPNRFIGAVWFMFKAYAIVALICSIINYEWWT